MSAFSIIGPIGTIAMTILGNKSYYYSNLLTRTADFNWWWAVITSIVASQVTLTIDGYTVLQQIMGR